MNFNLFSKVLNKTKTHLFENSPQKTFERVRQQRHLLQTKEKNSKKDENLTENCSFSIFVTAHLSDAGLRLMTMMAQNKKKYCTAALKSSYSTDLNIF